MESLPAYAQFIAGIFNESIFLATFLISLFGGEPLVALLAALSPVHIFELLIAAFLSAVVAECFWFFIARTRLFSFLQSNIVSKHMSTYASKINIEKPFRQLFLSRFVTGLTIVLIIYMGRKQMPFSRFFISILAVNSIWTPAIVLLGILARKQFDIFYAAFESVQLSLALLLILVIVLHSLYRVFISKNIDKSI